MARSRHPDLEAYLALLGLGDPFAAHEALEAAWRRDGDVLAHADAAQGLIQVAAAFVHRDRGNRRGARVLAERARARLEGPCTPDAEAALEAAGVDRAALCARLEALPDELSVWPAPLALVAPGRV